MQGMAYEDASQFQRIQIVETVPFGKTLVLDGKSQSARFDEFVYHECLVHPAMLLHGQPRNVFIGGGGELATAREVRDATRPGTVLKRSAGRRQDDDGAWEPSSLHRS
eukprot:scaffold3250_cov222-Pinguiococcus_pyrenoidosus.AAC.4